MEKEIRVIWFGIGGERSSTWLNLSNLVLSWDMISKACWRADLRLTLVISCFIYCFMIALIIFYSLVS